MSNHCPHYQRGLSRAASLLIAMMLGLGGVATVALWPSGDTNAPALDLPADAAVIHAPSSGAAVTFEWRHGYSSLDNRNPRRVSDFVICVLDAPNQVCAWPGTFPAGDPRIPTHAWTESAGRLPRTGVSGTQFLEWFKLLNPALDAPYRYSFTPAGGIPATSFGRQLAWTVGACNGQNNDRCRYAGSRQIAFAGMTNLAATDKSDYFVNNVLTVDGLATNSGAFDSGAFEITIRLWQVMLGPDNQVRTDINSPQFNDMTEALFRDGSRRPRNQLPQISPGVYDESKIWGIFLQGGTSIVELDNYPGLAPGVELSVAQIQLSNPPKPSRHVVSFTVDPRYVIPETEENDNTYSRLTSLIQ